MYQHSIDNFKLIAEINVLASETFKTKLCWERSEKCYDSKSTVLPQNLSTIVAIVAMFFFCNNDHAYMYLYFFIRWWLQLFCSQLQILERRNLVSWKRNFVSSKRYFVSRKRNFTSWKRNFVLMTRNFVQRARNFVSINHRGCEISPTLEQ